MSSVIFDVRLMCNTPEKREKGLMHAEPLKTNEVAFFVFPHEDQYGFWNKNVSFDLSLAFADENRRIVDFADLEAQSEKIRYPKTSSIKYVIEAKKGAFDDLGIKRGDRIAYEDGILSVQKEK
jgi:uncharacterized protein